MDPRSECVAPGASCGRPARAFLFILRRHKDAHDVARPEHRIFRFLRMGVLTARLAKACTVASAKFSNVIMSLALASPWTSCERKVSTPFD